MTGARQPTRYARVRPLVAIAVAWLLLTIWFPSRPADVVAQADDVAVAGRPSLLDDGFNGNAPGAVTGSGAVAGGGAAAGSVGGAVTVGGLPCRPGFRQIPFSTYALPCVPKWSGANGGATFHGVTAKEIVIVERVTGDSTDPGAAALFPSSGGPSPAQKEESWKVFREYFDAHYELYGRKVRWVKWRSRYGDPTAELQSKGREGACLDADVIAGELGAFAVTGLYGTPLSGPFAECAAERKLVVFNGATYYSETFNRKYHPYVWGIPTDCERISSQAAEYLAKRMIRRPAQWAGSAELRRKERSFAVYVPDNDEYQRCVNIVREIGRKRYGIDAASQYNYTLDASRFPEEAARAIAQFKADGATTVVLACDPLSIIFLTQAAQSQDYHPEWFLIGVAAQDADNLARLYDQRSVDGHMFGMSQIGSGSEDEAAALFKLASGRDMVPGTAEGWQGLHLIYNLLQAAGPVLTPNAIGAGAFRIPAAGAPRFPFGFWSLLDGPDGQAGLGDHTTVDDSREIYWRDGHFSETYGGRRFRNGEWPAETPPVFP